MILFLDDNPDRHAGVARLFAGAPIIHAWTAGDAIQILKAQGPEFAQIWLDHDLGMGGSAEPGIVVAEWLAGQRPAWDARVVIHSWNPGGAKSMHDLLVDRGWNVVRQPFPELD